MTGRTTCGSLLLAIAMHGGSAGAGESGDVSLRIGPTDIPGGEARAATDITLRNSRLAVAFAVGTAGPWGVARGGIIDVAEIRDGEPARDRASLVDFMPNNWSSWPTTYQRVIVEKNTPAEAVLRTERDWEAVELVTTWTLAAGADRIHMLTRMTNRGAKPVADILSGYVLWPEGGHLFGVPGTLGAIKGRLESPGSRWSAAYDRDWMLGLHAPFADRFDDESRDRYLLHGLAPGDSRAFEAWFQVGHRGELAPLVDTEIELGRLPAGRLSGRVSTRAGNAVAHPAVVVEKQTGAGSFPYTWTVGGQGRYSLNLPAGTYRVYATAEAHASSRPVSVDVKAGATIEQDFADLEPPGALAIQVRSTGADRPLDARVAIRSGPAPLIQYFGRSTFFTDLERIGLLELAIAPGDYRFEVAASAGFRARPVLLDCRVAADTRQQLDARVELLADPLARDWYGGDLHHHSDVLDGFTEPQFVLRSELAAGVDVAFLSDHDSVINNREMQRLAALRGVPFIPASEFSPSWAHFNAYPLDADKNIDIDVGRATAAAIIKEARRMGAQVVAVNHPYIDYGYFRNQELGALPGGYSDAFDLVEITAQNSNERTVEHAWKLWNTGQRAYFSAGSDAHDVWHEASGTARMYVKLEGAFSTQKFIAALKQGHAFATQGPLVFPDKLMFGEQLRHRAGGELALEFTVQAVNGLRTVELIERGTPLATQDFDAPTAAVPVRFVVRPRANTWYSLVVADANGRRAWTNPVWVVTDGGG